MAKQVQAYDHPNFLVQREASGVVAAATSSYWSHYFFQRARVRGVHTIVLTAGTATATPKDAALEWRVFGPAGTTSFANHAYGTNTAMHLLHSTVTVTVATGQTVRASKLLDATGITLASIEYEILPDAVLS